MKIKDLSGQRFGSLVAISRTKTVAGQRWICRCDCGNKTLVVISNLTSGHTTSCGCYAKAATAARHRTHGGASRFAPNPLYRVWSEMRHRCSSVTHKQYVDYGARGIFVCETWLGPNGFATFLSDMGFQPSGTSLDRRNNDGPYSKENCRWATAREQSINKRNTRWVTAFGETRSLIEWAEKANIDASTIAYRLRVGWPADKAVSCPVRVRRKKDHWP